MGGVATSEIIPATVVLVKGIIDSPGDLDCGIQHGDTDFITSRPLGRSGVAGELMATLMQFLRVNFTTGYCPSYIVGAEMLARLASQPFDQISLEM